MAAYHSFRLGLHFIMALLFFSFLFFSYLIILVLLLLARLQRWRSLDCRGGWCSSRIRTDRHEFVQQRFNMPECLFSELKKGRSFPAHEIPVGITNNESGTSQLAVSHGHVRPRRNVSIHNLVAETKHLVKGHCDLRGFDADAQELDRGNCGGPFLHLCRTGAAPASPTIVKMNDGRLSYAGKQSSARGHFLVDSILGRAMDQMDVEITDRFSAAIIAKIAVAHLCDRFVLLCDGCGVLNCEISNAQCFFSLYRPFGDDGVLISLWCYIVVLAFFYPFNDKWF